MTLGFGLIGFLDDYLKVVLGALTGCSPREDGPADPGDSHLCLLLVKFTDIPLTMLIPFSGGRYLDIGWLVPLLFVAVIGTVNGGELYGRPGRLPPA